MKKLFHLLAGLSLLLFIATVALWVRSYYRWDHVEIDHRVGHAGDKGEPEAFVPGPIFQILEIRNSQGCIDFSYCAAAPGIPSDTWIFTHESAAPISLKPNGLSFWNRLGFAWYPSDTEPGCCAPLWIIALLTFVLPTLWIVKQSRRKQVPEHCRRCGYDLRATPARCPECGTVK